jgi:hypothetical protein
MSEGEARSDRTSGRVDLKKQMAEIERLRREMAAMPFGERKVTTRAVARILEDVYLGGRIGKVRRGIR